MCWAGACMPRSSARPARSSINPGIAPDLAEDTLTLVTPNRKEPGSNQWGLYNGSLRARMGALQPDQALPRTARTADLVPTATA
jgi:adenylate cyclase